MIRYISGPWKFTHNKTQKPQTATINDHRGGFIAELQLTYTTARSYEEQIAAARLIAAAPQLLEAVEAVIGVYDRGDENETDLHVWKCREALEALRRQG